MFKVLFTGMNIPCPEIKILRNFETAYSSYLICMLLWALVEKTLPRTACKSGPNHWNIVWNFRLRPLCQNPVYSKSIRIPLKTHLNGYKRCNIWALHKIDVCILFKMREMLFFLQCWSRVSPMFAILWKIRRYLRLGRIHFG